MPPSWCPDLIIRKYADPMKDGSFVDFCRKKEKVIAKIQAKLDAWEPELKVLKKKIANAQRTQKKLKLSLKNAKARRRG